MPLHEPKYVLIFDNENDRADAIEKTLKQIWDGITVHIIYNPNEINIPADFDFDTIMFTWRFVENVKALPKAGVVRVFISKNNEDQVPDEIKIEQHIVAEPTIAPNDGRLKDRLKSFLQPPPSRVNLDYDKNDDLLKLQIRRFDKYGRSLSEGEKILTEIIALFMSKETKINEFKLNKLKQGFSGANVFLISYELNGKQEKQVLKLTPDEEYQRWKCRQEIKCYQDIMKNTAPSPIQMIPDIHGIGGSMYNELMEVRKHGWSALMYSVIDDQTFTIVDFETFFLDPCKNLSKSISSSQDFLEGLFDKFLDKWYAKEAKFQSRELWSTKDASEVIAIEFPPYCFRGWEKGRIVESLYSLDPYGESFFIKDWELYKETILQLVSTEQSPLTGKLEVLQKEHNVMCCPVHGDLNANNVFMALDFGMPFLIDFACYQREGHAVQDFARLEVAIKIELMGKEKKSDILGMDLDLNQLNKWYEAEECLCSWHTEDDLPASIKEDKPENKSVKYAYHLCWFIRQRAMETYNNLSRFGKEANLEFELSYNVALLYHTIRAIRYDSLPHLKRIFAVYSANKVVEQISESMKLNEPIGVNEPKLNTN